MIVSNASEELMSSRRIRVIFSLLGLLAGGIAAIALYVFLGPNGENLGVAGIAGVTHLLIFPITSALTAGIVARSLIGNAMAKLTRATGFVRGAATGAVAFVASVLVHAIVLFLRLDAEAALWLALSALLFGGLAFGLPAALLSGVTGAFVAKKS